MKIFVAFVVAVTVGLASAVTKEELEKIRDAAQPFMLSCGEEFGITKDDILKAKQDKDINALDSCFYACFFKKTGLINDAGVFVPEVFVEKNKKHISDPTSIEEFTKVGNTCAQVNDEAVSDGEKGCERAKLLAACLSKEKAKYAPFAA